ncbi:MAG: rod shape-determining protein MreC [Prochlorococcus marinus XMU1422]|nr:rod shape-determining protein MreC [Prochlorococcus marinus XMU1421]MBO7012998.1 rod shape-determining protein MreC [Prochlorococcus marinus XMU1422]MCR8541887.1 rod shape-determining protein MreC [Prochlorococcus marinus XMU1423]
MLNIRRISTSRWWHKKKNWLFFAIFLFLVFVRISKGAFYKDFYYFISKPFWPDPNQKEIVFESINQEYLIKLNLLRKDNTRLRQILSLQESSNDEYISAAVISRKTGSWWRQIILNKGSKDGVEIGDIVIGPGGLLGRVKNTSLFTSSVTLITSPESKLGVWVDRIQINGLLVGLGDNYPSLILYSKDTDIKVGDFVSSSPASTLLPPNIPIGIVQSIDETLQSKKTAKISLLAKPHVIDWVQILKVNIQ